MKNDFDQELKYSLYRSIKDILHPTISKKNISDYKIILNELMMPVRVFYPKKVSDLGKIFIYIHGDGKLTKCSGEYSNISSRLAMDFNQLVISIDYEKYNDLKLLDLYNKLFDTFKYIYKNLLECGIGTSDITLVGDSTGASAVLSIVNKLKETELVIPKQILFYPLVSGEYFGKSRFNSIIESSKYDYELLSLVNKYYVSKTKYKKDLKDVNLFALNNKVYDFYPKTLVVCGSVDPIMDEDKEFVKCLLEKAELVEVPFAGHGFLKNINEEIISEYREKIKVFLN